MIDLPSYDALHWQNDALCFRLAVDPNVMQPEKATREDVAEAIALCAGCPVIDACRKHAEDQDAQHAEAQTGAYGVHAGKWWGPDPTWLVESVCAWEGCGKSFRAPERVGNPVRFCGATCRQRHSRAQRGSA